MLDPDLSNALMDKGKKLQQFKVISEHAKTHLAELNNKEAAKRYY